MNKTKAIGLGLVLGAMMGLIYASYEADKMEAEFHKEISEQIAAISVEPIVVEEQIIIDADEVVIMTAPYPNIPLDDEYQIYLEQRCADYGIDYFLVIALMESESNFDTEAEGDSDIGGSVGLMQINNCWWESMYKKGIDVFDVRGNIDASLIILNEYLEKYQDEATAIQMYKCGEPRGRELLSMGIVISQAKDVVTRAEEIKKETTR